MKHFRNRRKRWRTQWPWKHLFPLRVDERFCKECGQTYHEGPYPKPVDDYVVNHIGINILPSGGWKTDEFVIHSGRWSRSRSGLYLSEMIPEKEIDDHIHALLWAKQRLATLRNNRSSKARGLPTGSQSGLRLAYEPTRKKKKKVRHQG